MDSLARDLRFALRLIRKAPVLSTAVIVTLALGLGLNAGVFTVLSGLLMRPRVSLAPETFVHLQPEYAGTNVPRHESPALSTRDFLALRERTTTLQTVAAWTVRDARIGENAPFHELTMLVSCEFFDVYGLKRVERGRTFRADECSSSAVPVAVISDELWTRHFAGDSGILGQPLVIDGQPFTIVGITPPGFPGRVRGEGVWIPYAWEPAVTRGAAAFGDPNTAWLWVDGRLKPAVTAAAAVSELNLLMRQQDTLSPGRTTAVAVNNGALIHDPAVRPVAMFVMPLVMGSVGLVLLDRVRQRDAAAALPRGGAAARDRYPSRDWLQPRPPRPDAAHRKPCPRGVRYAAEHLARVAGPRRDAPLVSDDAGLSDGPGRHRAQLSRGGVARRRPHGGSRAGDRIAAAAAHADAGGTGHHARRETPGNPGRPDRGADRHEPRAARRNGGLSQSRASDRAAGSVGRCRARHDRGVPAAARNVGGDAPGDVGAHPAAAGCSIDRLRGWRRGRSG